MEDWPLIAKCNLCGKDAKRTDRKRNGIYAIFGSILLGGFSLYFSHWIIAFFDWLIPFVIGVYWIMKKERYLYHCKHCTAIFNPYENADGTTRE